MSELSERLVLDQSCHLSPTDEENTQIKPEEAGFFCCLSLGKYFDVEEQEVWDRLRSAAILRPPFHQVVGHKPDLFGPFWIASTLVILLLASSSLLWFINGEQGTFNYEFVPVASSMIFGITFVCPYLVGILVKVFGGKMAIVRLVCIYGYSMVSFLLPTVFCFIKSDLIQSVVLGLGFVVSVLFLVQNVLSIESLLAPRQKYVVVSLLIGVQLGLVATYKLYFFQF